METPTAASQRVFAPGILEGQVAVITGGGSGIGLATAREMIRLGARVAVCGRTPAKLDAAKAELGDQAFVMACDIREPAQVEEFVKATIGQFGRVDTLVNNAGGQFPSPSQKISPNGFLAVIKNNLVGTFHMAREVANQWMIPNKGG